MFKTKFVRIISIIGILSLLVLQYIWFQNSYTLMEYDVLEKSEKNLNKAVESEIFERLNLLSIDVSVNNKIDYKQNDELLTNVGINKSNDINSSLQDLLVLMGKPCSVNRVDTLFQEVLLENLSFIPSYSIKMVSDTTKEKTKESKYTLYNKITDKQYIEVVLKSPMGSILREAQLILIFSILLAILIGVILVVQLRGMLRENRFVIFIKEYTNALTHELKTPISGIFMSASQLTSGKLEDKPETRQKYYQICRDQSSKMLATVERLLVVAKAEHTKIIPNIEDVDAKNFIEKIANSFRLNNYRQKDLEIFTHLPDGELIGKFDPVLIENVMSNLIDNAIKYSDSSVKIDIICGLQNKNLRLSIKDNGFGISDKEKKHIFDNFERGNRIENKGIDGFGIGLNYVQKVIKAHNGTIKVESVEGKGSEFIIELPN